MGMTGIAKYMYFSRAIDLTREQDRRLRLPDGHDHRTVLMAPKQAASLSLACSRRVIDMLLPV